MANEECPKQEIRIMDSSKRYDDMASFYLKETFSDVQIILSDRKIPAHKIVLAARCKFFEDLLLRDPKQVEVNLPDVSPQAFLMLLQYIYTGCITFVDSNEGFMFDVIKLANRYSLATLTAAVGDKIKDTISTTNVCILLNKGTLYDMDVLVAHCLDFMDEHVLEGLETDFFNVLTQKALIRLLERDAFPVPEIDVFRIVESWCKVNKDVDSLVASCIRLPLLSKNEILKVVRHSRIVDRDALFEVLDAIENGSPRNTLTRSSQNFAVAELNVKVTSGKNYQGNENLKFICHNLGNKDGVVVDLARAYYFNNIKLKLGGASTISYSYFIEISNDRTTWKRILDYSTYQCSSHQNLYFEKQKARFIKIVGTFATYGNEFRVEDFEVYFKSEVPEIVNGVVRPKTNVATSDMGASVLEGGRPHLLLNGDINTDSCWHKIGDGHIVIRLAQPYLLSSLKLLLFDRCYYRYLIETSIDRHNWEIALDRRNENCKSWQHLQFTERPTTFIRLTGTSSWNGNFLCVHFECPAFN